MEMLVTIVSSSKKLRSSSWIFRWCFNSAMVYVITLYPMPWNWMVSSGENQSVRNSHSPSMSVVVISQLWDL